MTAEVKAEDSASETPKKKGPLSKLLPALKLYWSPPRESFFARLLILLCIFTVATMGVSTVIFLKIRKAEHKTDLAAHHSDEENDEHGEAEEHAAAEGAHGGGHGASEQEEQAVLGGSKIHKSVLARRDGHIEPGHDLIEPDIESTRSIASLLKNELKVDFGARYVELPEIFTSLRDGVAYDGKLILNIALEVNSTEAKVEIEKRSTEIRSLISAVASERQKQSMLTTKGILSFKEEVFREIALLVGAGKVSDVLITNYNVR